MVAQRLIDKQPFKDKIAVIPGGSKGIGKETAKLFVQLGGSVCLIARSQDALQQASVEAEALRRSDHQFVDTIACDTTDYDALKPQLDSFVKKRGAPDYLLNMVGYAYPQYLEKLTLPDFQKNMDVNYYGQLVPTLILLPYLIGAKQGHIAFTSSMLGFMGIMGYATYAPSKYALVGLAEVIRNEMKPYNLRVSLLYPPDTDTPGFAIENQTKPPETAILSETAKLFTPEQVADVFIHGLINGKFHILVGEGRWIWRMARFFPWLVQMFIDQDYAKARKKVGR